MPSPENSPETTPPQASRQASHSGVSMWPIAFTLIALMTIVVTGIVVYRLLILPIQIIENGMSYVGDGIVAVYKDGKKILKKTASPAVTQLFQSYVANNEQVQRLVVYRAEKLEFEEKTFTRGPSEAEIVFLAPVEYTYYVDMSRPWDIDFEAGILKVVVPPLECQRPNIMWEKGKEFINPGLLIPDEGRKVAELRKNFSTRAQTLSMGDAYLQAAKQQARLSLVTFLNNWISDSLGDEYEVLGVLIRFADEEEYSGIYPVPDSSLIQLIPQEKPEKRDRQDKLNTSEEP